MSIWMSHPGGFAVPERDEYTGDPTDNDEAQYFDVATSGWAGDVFRFCVYPVVPHTDGWQYGSATSPNIEVLLTAAEARDLVKLIESGIAAIESAT